MAPGNVADFQGAVIVNLDAEMETLNLMYKILNYANKRMPSFKSILGMPYYELKLDNKYYDATIGLFDNFSVEGRLEESREQILSRTEAIIIHADGTKVTRDQLDLYVQSLKSVCGEPRILLYHSINEDCESFKTLQNWCIENKYDFIEYSDDLEELINSLSAYRWSKLKMKEQERSAPSQSSQSNQQANAGENPLKQIQEFDDLLKQINSFKDSPEDDILLEIADKLSFLMGEGEINELINGDEKQTNGTEDAGTAP